MPQALSQDIPFCIICAAPSGEYSIKLDNYSIYKCNNCGLEYTWPIPSEDTIRKFYSQYSDIRASQDIVSMNAKRNFEKISNYFGCKNISILDFGCGNGEFVNISGDQCFGIELHRNSENSRIFTSINEVKEKKFDAITLWGVLEHLTDPVMSLSEIKSMLKKDGIVVITTVNAEGVIPFYHKPPEHLTYWTKRSMEIFLAKFNLDIVEYNQYEMLQKSDIYIDRLLSRTPSMYKGPIMQCRQSLPDIVEIPTNEVFVVARSRDHDSHSSRGFADENTH